MVVIPISVMIAATGRDKIETRLRESGAVTAERAVLLGPLSDDETAGLEEALALGTVMRSRSGRVFLNPAVVTKGSGEGVFTLLLFLIATASIVASVIALIAVLKPNSRLTGRRAFSALRSHPKSNASRRGHLPLSRTMLREDAGTNRVLPIDARRDGPKNARQVGERARVARSRPWPDHAILAAAGWSSSRVPDRA